MLMSDFDLGYFYFEHDKHQEAKELEASGISFIRSGLLLVVVSLVILLFVRRAEVLLLTVLGMVLIIVGKQKQAGMLQHEAVDEHTKRRVSIEVHSANQGVVFSPSALKYTISKPFSSEISLHLAERERIASIISRNSGSNINAVYAEYRNNGGIYSPEHFVKALHSMKKNGLVKVTKTVSQTSRIPSVST